MKRNKVQTETPVPYAVRPSEAGPTIAEQEDRTIAEALAIVAGRMRTGGPQFETPALAKDYLKLKIGNLEHEEFHVLFLDVQLKLIEDRVLGLGTIDHADVYPREVAKAALATNAWAVLLAHNHPSGVAQPSRPDRELTRAMRSALELLGTRVLDHFVVTANDVFSFAEHNLLR